ncbi:MAG: acyloxyacyl hydrolase [Acidobacteriota bacterium]
MRRALVCSIYLLTAFIFAQAQTAEQLDGASEPATAAVDVNPHKPERRNWRLKRGAKELGFEFSYAPMQPTFFSGRKEYDTDGRKFAMTSFRFGRVVGTAKHVTFEYLFEVIPVSFAMKNEVDKRDVGTEKDDKKFTKTIRENTYGIGFEPASFRFLFAPAKRLKPFVQVGAGFIFTSKPIPVPESPRYNFIGDFGGGLMFSVSEKRTINFGYRYFHISNMNIGEINPGYNANVFYLGYSIFSK